MKIRMRILAASLLIAASPMASAQTPGDVDAQVKLLDTTAANKGQTLVADKIAAFFTNLAGSKENAVALVTALRNGTVVNLTTPTTGTGTGTGTGTTTTTFTPPTGKMGWGNVKIALGLAQDALLQAGITKPTAQQLQTALLGGTITKADGTAVTLKGVLQMRADGMGWGQIAHAGGTKVGPVVSSLKATQAQLAKLPAAGTGTTAPTTTAATSSTATGGKKAIATATGATSTGGSGGLVTAAGATSAHQPQGNAYGRGLVTGAGTTAGSSVAATGVGKPSVSGAGVLNAGGGNAAGVTTAQGNAGGNGKGQGQGQGKGKGG